MYSYIARRLAFGALTVVGVSIMVFVVMRILPGDPLVAIFGPEGMTKLTEEQRASYMAELGLSDPLWVQYLRWVKDIIRGNFGQSFFRSESVADMILRRGPLTAEIALISVVLSWLVGIPVAIVSALRPNTVADSAARFVMADSTNLSLGPSATLKLDRTVFNDEHSYRDVAIRMTTGAFRFVTGHSEKTAYKITTPLATIGVCGTTLDILSQRGRSVVVLQDGAASVCTTSQQCVQLTQPGDTAIITSTGGKVSISKTNTPPWTFAATCAASAGLCAVNQYADASPTITPAAQDDGMLCGR